MPSLLGTAPHPAGFRVDHHHARRSALACFDGGEQDVRRGIPAHVVGTVVGCDVDDVDERARSGVDHADHGRPAAVPRVPAPVVGVADVDQAASRVEGRLVRLRSELDDAEITTGGDVSEVDGAGELADDSEDVPGRRGC
jgi:hypothetical protein